MDDNIRRFVNEAHVAVASWTLDPNLLLDAKIDDPTARRLLERALRWFHSIDRPGYLGHLSVLLGINLRRMEILANVMIDNAAIRVATLEEKFAIDAPRDAQLFVVPGRCKPGLASR